MNQIFQFEDADFSAGNGKNAVLGIGVFDGVHCGHRAILEAVTAESAVCGAMPGALTFDPHPRSVLTNSAPELLVSLAERKRLLREAGAAFVGTVRFSRALAQVGCGEFLEMLLTQCPFPVSGICVGSNWRFGRGGQGNAAFLADFCAKRKLRFRPVPEVRLNGEIISSSLIRRAIAAGDLTTAERMLGRPCRVTGHVGTGYQAAGEVLHCPTANLIAENGIFPPDGVYAAKVFLEKMEFPAILNIGYAPTFGWEKPERRLEVHLIGFDGNLYGREMTVEFLKFLRREKKFDSPAMLAAQIQNDLSQVKAYFEGGI